MKLIVGINNIKIDKSDTLNSGEYNVHDIEFEFDEVYEGLVKKAVFSTLDHTYQVSIIDNTCTMPYEVTQTENNVKIGVYAYEVDGDDLVLRYSPKPITKYVNEGSYKEHYDNWEEVTPTDKEQMEQMLENINIQGTKVDNVATISITNKDGITHEVELYDGEKGDKGDKGDKGEQGIQGEQGVQGIQGVPGPQGEAFTIKKTYSSVAEMNADFDNMQLGDYVMIASSVEIQDNAKLYTRGIEEWIFITDFSGATGIQGEQGPQGEQGIQGPQGIQGIQGETGATGNGIASIAKTSTSGLVDTYTITYTNGNTTTFNVSNGKGITSITKTGSVSNIDTYTILFNDGTTTTYEVANGEVTQASFDELKEETNLILDQIPKGTANGESINVNDSSNLPLKDITLKGNTSQVQYSGKNLLNNSATTTGIFTVNEDKTITINGSPTSDTYINLYSSTSTPLVIDTTKTYTFSIGVQNENIGIAIYEYIDNNWVAKEYVYNFTSRTYTPSENITGQMFRIIVKGNSSISNVKAYPMLIDGTTIGDYEPYCGGTPSPNPDYPQDIHSVSGDNEIEVCGKNLILTTDSNYFVKCTYVSGANTNEYKLKCTQSDMYFNDVSNAGVSYNSARHGNLIPCSYGETIYYDTGNSLFTKILVNQFDENLVSLGFTSKNTSSGSYTPTNANCKFITMRIGYGSSVVDTIYTLAPIVSKTNDLTYEPYKGNTYPLYLGVENLQNGTTDFSNYVNYLVTNTKDDESITITSTANNTYAGTTFDKTIPKAGTYTLQMKATFDTNGLPSFRIGSSLYATKVLNTNYYLLYATFTTTSDNETISVSLYPSMTTNASTHTAKFYDFQIEKGTKANHYTPYGTTPIEMRGINERKDTFVRTSGENIFNVIDYTNLVLSNNSSPSNVVKTTDKITFTANGNWSGINLTNFINSYVDNGDTNTTYYVSLDVKVNANTTCQIGNVTKEDVSLTSGTQRIFVATQFTSSTSFVIYNRTSDTINYEIANIMVSNQDNIDYEPYGTNEWYKKESIDKDLVKPTNINALEENGARTNYFLTSFPIQGYEPLYCTHLRRASSWDEAINVNNNTPNMIGFNGNGQCLCNISGYTTKQEYQDFFDNNDVYVYYPKKITTYKKITDTNLINQLEAIYKARTKKNVTNISQVNNDEAFTIDIVYYKDLETLFNSLAE